MPIVRQVQRVRGTTEALGRLPDALADACCDQLAAHVTRDLPAGDHVQLLLVDGRAVRVNFFVDHDGTLWVEQVGTGS